MYTYNLGQKFKQVAASTPDATALLTETGIYTYAQLDEESDALAAYFLSNGLKSGDVVCISGEKHLRSLACLIGALKAGVTYSMFDPESPTARLEKIFARCNPSMILCGESLVTDIAAAGFSAFDFQKLELDANRAENANLVRNQLPSITASTPAYIMFTSGSTGFPKGAVMSHQNVLNLIEWSLETYDFHAQEVLTSVNPFYFDNSVFDIYSSLFSGASLALFDGQTVRDPAKLLRLIDEYKCTSWFSVPSMLIYLQTVKALRTDSFKHLKRIIFGGEGYPKARLKNLFDLFSDRIKFYNVYGPTECTCICSSYFVGAEDFTDLKGYLPLGYLAPNFSGLVVDEDLRPVREGDVGELLLRGANVGLGYYRDSERTEFGFIQNPINNEYRETVYRTGDLVFVDSFDRKIWIVGRADNQIKHMGYRIELEEIENALTCCDSVEQSAVVHCEIRGLSQIVAFVRAKDGKVDEELLRRDLNALIPQYMVPTRFEFRSQLPRNANGKLDRKQLKAEYMEQLVNG